MTLPLRLCIAIHALLCVSARYGSVQRAYLFGGFDAKTMMHCYNAVNHDKNATKVNIAEIINPDAYINGVPHATFRYLRDKSPVHWIDEADGSGFWSVTRYADLIEVSRQPQIFSNATGIRLEDMDAEERKARETMMELDPPDHTAQWRLVNPPFAPRSVASYTADLRQLARDGRTLGAAGDQGAF